MAVVGVLASAALLAACTDLGVGLPGTTGDTPAEGARPVTSAGVITEQQAAAAALAAIGTGQVTWIGPEDDRGAAWEVEITRPDGSEVDVLVAADGRIIATIDRPGSGPRPGTGDSPPPPAGNPPATPPPATPPTNGTGVITQQQAAAAALAAIGTGQVTWIGPEDDRGAAWEVEITRPDGSEVDVLVAADGRIIATIG